MSLHKNRVKMTSATTGTGTLTLGSASSGYQSFATAYGADATVDILITEGTAWEVARDCAYTNSGTTVGRGTLEASSTGSAVSFGGTQVVSVIATAGAGQQTALNHVALADANTTMIAGSMYVGSMAAWATADRTYTLPTTANVGDRIGVMITGGNASYELILTAGTSDTLNGVAGGTEWSRLFITNEVVIMRCVTANSAWVVEQDGRINTITLIDSNATTQTLTRNADTKITTALAVETSDPSSEWDATNKKFVARRAGNYHIFAFCQMASLIDQKAVQVSIRKNGTAAIYGLVIYASGAGSPGSSAGGMLSLAVGDEIEMYVYHEDASTNRETITGAGRVGFQFRYLGN